MAYELLKDPTFIREQMRNQGLLILYRYDGGRFEHIENVYNSNIENVNSPNLTQFMSAFDQCIEAIKSEPDEICAGWSFGIYSEDKRYHTIVTTMGKRFRYWRIVVPFTFTFEDYINDTLLKAESFKNPYEIMKKMKVVEQFLEL